MPKGNIQVFLRERPTRRPSGFFAFDPEHGQVVFDVPLEKRSYLVNNTKTHYKFKFDGLFGARTEQDEIFTTVAKDAADNALAGFNATIFAYGQTGSGKTFTMTGGTQQYKDRGIIPRCLEYIFEQAKERKGEEFRVFVSYLELYNGQGMDLLTDEFKSGSIGDLPRVTLREDEMGEIQLQNLSRAPVTSQEEALELLFLGDTNRAICETPMNPVSSRSHCIFTIGLESRAEGSSKIRRSKLHLVDLAGSERVSKTHASGQLLVEANNINVSLHFLQMVIVALQNKAKKKGGSVHVPYRNSLLTSVLRDSLGGNCVTTMIATVNAEPEHTDESVSTCRFAQRVASVSNAAFVNEETDPNVLVRQLREQMEQKEAELEFLRGEAGEGEELSPEEVEELQRIVQRWVASGGEGDLPIGRMTLRRIQFAFKCLYDLAARSPGWDSGAAGAPGTAAGGGRGGADPEALAAAEEEARKLRQQLAQRDHEIAILVGMVRNAQGGSGGAGMSAATQASAGASQGGRGGPTVTSATPGTSGGLSALTGGAASIPAITLPNGAPLAAGSMGDKEAVRKQYMAAHRSAPEVAQHAETLRDKYSAAKALGTRVNAARSRINSLKEAVEARRVERAMAGISGGAAAEGGGKESAEVDPEEESMVAEMGRCKEEYKEGFAMLKRMKAEIEYTQKLVEAGKVKAASDFEKWYAASKDALEALSSSDGPPQPQQRTPRAVGAAAAVMPGAGAQAAPSPAQSSSTGSPTVVDGVELPPGIKLTGNAAADAEIVAFFKAKQKLMQRSKARASAVGVGTGASHK